jgi:hypothetical protein
VWNQLFDVLSSCTTNVHFSVMCMHQKVDGLFSSRSYGAPLLTPGWNFLFGWLVADGWCWFVLREEYCWLVAGGWFVERKVLLAGG